ncbi:MAG: hypothetical protein WCO44_05070 [Bacteroidota bacterium]
MIQYLRHTEIDKPRWDECISNAVNGRVYGYSWYLDVVCPGWEALAEEDYSSVFPLTHNRKWGIRYLYQPYFTQQLGLFSRTTAGAADAERFIAAIPPAFRFAEIQLNAMNNLPVERFNVTQRVNHELSIAQEYATISGRYAQNTKRNIRKAAETGLSTSREITTKALVELFRVNFGKKEGKLLPAHYAIISNLINYCLEHRLGYISGVSDNRGTLCAAAFFLFDHGHVCFLFAASAPRARENGAMFRLIDHFLAENAGKYDILDFEGGNDPNLGRFYKGFGAEEVTYPAVRINRLPGPVSRLLYFARKFR